MIRKILINFLLKKCSSCTGQISTINYGCKGPRNKKIINICPYCIYKRLDKLDIKVLYSIFRRDLKNRVSNFRNT